MAANSDPTSYETINVQLYDSSCLRPRTTSVHGLNLPERRELGIPTDAAFLDDQKQYLPSKRMAKLEKRLAGKNCREKRETFRKENLILVDLERTTALKDLIYESIPIFALKTFKDHGEKRYMEFDLSKEASDDIRKRDGQDRFATAMKIAYANYLHWSKVYEENDKKEKLTEFERARQEGLEDFLQNPLECKGVIYCYQVIDETQADETKYQVYVGKSEGEFNRRLKEHNTSGNKSLFELSLQDKKLWPSEDQQLKKRFKDSIEKPKSPKKNEPPPPPNDDEAEVPVLHYEPKVIVLVLDFGYTKKLEDRFKGQTEEGDAIEKLVQNYVQYFGGNSPIGLND